MTRKAVHRPHVLIVKMLRFSVVDIEAEEEEEEDDDDDDEVVVEEIVVEGSRVSGRLEVVELSVEWPVGSSSGKLEPII